MFIWKIETSSQYYIIFVNVSKIDLPLPKTKIGLFSTKNDFKVSQVSEATSSGFLPPHSKLNLLHQIP